MATNIEIKARVRDLEGLKALVEELSDTACETISQEDTFFHTPHGRLKLRVLAPDRGELIYYERPDGTAPRASHYLISPTTEPGSLNAILTAALGVRGTVRKQRSLYFVRNTRIHLDQVADLGSFMELEVVLTGEQTQVQGRATAFDLMKKLGILDSDLIDVAYIDLLEGHDD